MTKTRYELIKHQERPHNDGFQTTLMPIKIFEHERASACLAYAIDSYEVIDHEVDRVDGILFYDGFAVNKANKEGFVFTIQPVEKKRN